MCDVTGTSIRLCLWGVGVGGGGGSQVCDVTTRDLHSALSAGGGGRGRGEGGWGRQVCDVTTRDLRLALSAGGGEGEGA